MAGTGRERKQTETTGRDEEDDGVDVVAGRATAGSGRVRQPTTETGLSGTTCLWYDMQLSAASDCRVWCDQTTTQRKESSRLWCGLQRTT